MDKTGYLTQFTVFDTLLSLAPDTRYMQAPYFFTVFFIFFSAERSERRGTMRGTRASSESMPSPRRLWVL